MVKPPSKAREGRKRDSVKPPPVLEGVDVAGTVSPSDSTTQPTQPTQPQNAQNAPQNAQNAQNAPQNDEGGQVTPPGDGPAEEGVTRTREKRKGQVWEQLRRDARKAGLTRRDSVAYAGREIDRLFPPDGSPGVEAPAPPEPLVAPEPPPPEPAAGNGDHLAGLAEIPDDWPELPDNAALGPEVQWVQANRIRVRDGDRVDLARARTPAPSHAALSWLETAILYPAKWADITARATATQEDERESVRRERLAISEIDALLAEMLPGPPCPTCGQGTPPGWEPPAT